MQQSQISCSNIIKVDLYIFPPGTFAKRQTFGEVRGLVQIQARAGGCIHTFIKFSSKQVDTHDAKDEPEDETDKQHIHNGGNGTKKSVDHHLLESSKTLDYNTVTPRKSSNPFYFAVSIFLGVDQKLQNKNLKRNQE